MKSHNRVLRLIPAAGALALARQRKLVFALALILYAVPATPQNVAGVLSFSLRREGIMPPTATVSAGKVLVRVSNRLGLGTLSLQILDSSSAQLATIELARGKWESVTPVTFAAGTYKIQVTNSPSLSAAITVQP